MLNNLNVKNCKLTIEGWSDSDLMLAMDDLGTLLAYGLARGFWLQIADELERNMFQGEQVNE